MKKYSVLIILSLFYILNISALKAQNDGSGTISGIVIDRSSGQPLEAVVIGVFSDSSKVKGAETDPNGKYSVKVPYGTYRVEINYIGYSIANVNKVSVSANKPNVILDTVKLRQGSATTEEIDVTSERSSIELLPDKKVFNVGQDIVNNGGSATDVLKNIPSVSVDVDGNVSLRGSGNVKILVDGKPSGLDGSSKADILQQIPTNMIQSIELVTNPSAKYEAESSAGIINIVLKKNIQALGYSGNFSLGAGTQDKYNGSANLTLKTDKFNVYGNYNYRLFNFGMLGTSSRQDLFNNTSLNQSSNSTMRMRGQFAKVGVDYIINPKNSISLSSTYNNRMRTRNDITTNDDLNSSGTLTDYSINKNNSTNKGSGIDVSLNYNGFFKSPKQTLTGEVSYSHSTNDNTSDVNLITYAPDGSQLNINPNLQNSTTNTIQNYTNIQFDYVQPFGGSNTQLGKGKGNNDYGKNGKGNRGNKDNGSNNRNGNNPRSSEPTSKLEAGVRSIFRSTDNNYVNNFFDSTQQSFVYNSALSNHFKYAEQIHAGYLIFSSKIKNFGYQVGLRTEETIAKGDLLTNGTSFKNNYLDFFPNISLSQKISAGDEVQAIYSRKINRPRLNDLNPFVEINDPLNISVGNPLLKPEYENSYELNYLKFFNTTTLEASAFYKQTNNEIVRSRFLTDSGVTVTTKENLASSKSYGLELIAISQVTPWLSFNGSISYFKSVLKGDLSTGGVDNSNYSWNGKISSNIKLWGGVDMQLLYNYQGEEITPQGQSKPEQSLDAAIKKDFFNGRATVSFRVSDVFNTQKFNIFTQGTGFIQNTYRKRDSRVAFLTLSFKLGSIDYKQKPNRRKTPDNNDNGDDSGN